MESVDGPGIEGAFVVLIDSDNEIVEMDLTSRDGAFELGASEPGTYRLRSERIGYETTLTESFTLDRGQIKRPEIVSSMMAISLEPIAVKIRQTVDTEDRECRTRPGEVEDLAVAWEEARKALAGTAWTTREGMLRMKVFLYDRLFETKTGRMIQQQARNKRGLNRSSPFVSIGVDSLRDVGFAEFDESRATYYGPDPEVLLSDWFLRTHCFTMRAGKEEHEGLLGLEFRPVGDTSHPKIMGTLWLDPAESSLHSLEYRYTDVPGWVGDDAKGYLRFRRLDSGEWIVDKWWIQGPHFLPEDRRSGKWSTYQGGGRPGSLLMKTGGELLRAVPIRGEDSSPGDDS